MSAKKQPPKVTGNDAPWSLQDALAEGPNAPRLDRYEATEVTATIDRKRGIVTLTPAAGTAVAWDVRKVPLTEELDAALALLCSSDEQFLDTESQPRGWTSLGDLIHKTWFRAGLQRRMTQAQAAMRIFEARTHAAEKGGRWGGVYEGDFLCDDLIEAAIVGRVVKDVKRTESGESTIVVNLPFAPYIRFGDAVEYHTYAHQHRLRPGMMVLAATLPEDGDPKGAKVEPLQIEADFYTPYNFSGIEYRNRKGQTVPHERVRVIGAAIAYTPKGGKTQHAGNGIKFLRNVSPDERTTYAPHELKWSRHAGARMIFTSHDGMTNADLEFFFGVTLGNGSDGYRRERDSREDITVGVKFGETPSWAPHFHTAKFRVTKELPAVGVIFYAAWRVEYPDYPGHFYYDSGAAVLLSDGTTVLTDDEVRLPLSEVRVIGHAFEIGWEPRSEPAPIIDVEAIRSVEAHEEDLAHAA